MRGNLDVESEPIQLWYPFLWKNKEAFHFFLIQDTFLKEFRYMLIGAPPARITQYVEDFLKGKGFHVYEEDHSHIRSYGYEGIPFILPTFVCDRYFVVEVCK